MDAELAKKALKNASLNVKKTKGIILQTDLGSQYTSNIFEEYLTELKIRHSYSRKGCRMTIRVLNLGITANEFIQV